MLGNTSQGNKGKVMRYKMKKYIILGNGLDWCRLSFHGIEYREDVLFLDSKLPLDMNKMSSKIARYYFSNTLNRNIDLPFKKLWYPSIYRHLELNEDEEQYLIIYDKNMLGNNRKFLRAVRKTFPKLKLIYTFTNIEKYSGARINHFTDELSSYYDVVLAFDRLDSEKYGFEYSPLVYNANKKYMNSNVDSDVFYVGTAKDRLKMLISVFDKLMSMGIKCDFSIAEVNEDEIDNSKEITFNSRKSYSDVLDHISRTNCLLDVIQGNSTGLTIKTCEAICYDKKLITTNVHVKDYPFYDERYILVINNADDITKEFFTQNTDVKYKEEDKLFFSTEEFFKRIIGYLEMVNDDE